MAAVRQQANIKNGGLKEIKMYYRITGYYPEKNVSFIVDSNGKFEKLWQFSAYLKSKDCDIVAVSRKETMIDDTTSSIDINTKQFVIRSCYMGTPTWSVLKSDGIAYKSLRVGTVEYIPDTEEKVK